MTARSGRPKQQDTNQGATRESLINAARECFVKQGFGRVSTRKIAQVAGVDAAMIRYYFGSKFGLFEAMVKETLEPVISQFQPTPDAETPLSPLHLMQTYYRMIAATPMLPRLIQQVLNQHDSPDAFSILSGIFDNIILRSENWLNVFEQQNAINPNLKVEWIRLSFISLMVFPLLAPKHIQTKLGIQVTEDWLMALADHNNALLSQGLFAFPTQSDEGNAL